MPDASPDDSPKNLGRSSLLAAAASLASNAAQIGVGVVGTAVLARLLTPGDFGLMTLALTLFAFVGSLADFGLPHAVVHHATFDPQHAAGLFRLNALFAGGLGLAMAASGPIVAWVYGRPEIVALSVAVAGIVFFASILNLHVAVMRRRMRFGVLAVGEGVGLVVGTLGAVALAWVGAGVWALVFQVAGQQFGSGAAAWWRSGWRPMREKHPTYDKGDVSGVRRYARNVAAARVVANVGRNVDRVFVGTLAGASATGLYQKAYQWSVLPVQQVHQPLLNVAVSALSRLQRRDVQRYRFAVRQALTLVLSVTMPVSLLLLVEGRPVIRLLLGAQWSSSVPLFRVLCVAAFVTGLTNATKWIYLSEGQTRRQLDWSVISTPLMIVGVAAGAVIGRFVFHNAAAGVAWGFTLSTVVLAWPTVAYCTRTTLLRQSDLWMPAVRPAVAAVAAAVPVLAVAPDFGENYAATVATLAVAAGVYGVAFAAAWLAVPGGRAAVRDVVAVVKLFRRKSSD